MIRRELHDGLDLLAVMSANRALFPYLLQTAAAPEHGGSAYDILFAATGARINLGTSVFDELDHHVPALSDAPSNAELPFTGGWFAYFGYECAASAEPGLALPPFPALPAAFIHRCPAAVIADRRSGRRWLIAERGYDELAMRIQRCIESAPALSDDPSRILDGVIHEPPAGQFIHAVEAAKASIHAGDIYQANLSRRWSARLSHDADPVALYQRLCEHNPAPFAGLALLDDQAIVSSSPERLVSARGGRIETRPIAGTRPRGATEAEDAELIKALLENDKERAEHIMLIDLERNDLGRVCQPGSVVVDEFMAIESYEHVHHIVSNVKGHARPGTTVGELLRAVFPGGTITGCPKVRCMEIIALLEGEGRGPYTGSMGYITNSGDLDLNILIRTLHCHDGRVTLNAGGGIVADSNPLNELAETRAKARGLLLALDSGA